MLYSVNRFCTTGGKIRIACCGRYPQGVQIIKDKPTAWATIVKHGYPGGFFIYIAICKSELYIKCI